MSVDDFRAVRDNLGGDNHVTTGRQILYNIGDVRLAAWSYPDAYPGVGRITNLVSFEPDIISVHLDGTQLHLEPGQTVIPHGPDRDLTVDEVLRPGSGLERAPGGAPEAAAGG
ncbi:DUF427 domain-containing protein [Edaphobacter bradus]|uniref:DUF427 domain-containing protein n=1 Tax=Edaphobacter bradus TaxID=2259016 RepID=UPI0021E07BF5|nr:DUF427 domain-containing protein [Edaphobacter bradus]